MDRSRHALRLMSWNIHKAIGGLDRHCSLERIATVIRHYRPDVLTLQEVDHGAARSRHQDQAAELAAMLSMAHVAFAPTVRLSQGCYGNATLSHHRIVRGRHIDLTFPLKKARGALCTELAVRVGRRHRRLHVVNIHLGLSGVERRWQVKRLLRARPLARLGPRSRVVIAGDSNDWAGVLPGGRLAQAGFTCVSGTGARARRTFPAWGPVGALDKLFVRGPLALEHLLQPRLDLLRQASDHRPLVVDLALLPG